MTLPANIRINVQLPFPSLVYGTGPITIGKANGIWDVGFSIAPFGTIVPPIGDYPVDFFLGYNSNTGAFFKMSITNLVSALNVTVGATRNQRSVTATPITVGPTDQILNCRITSAAACVLPLASSRNGQALTFKDLGQASAHNITFTTTGGDTIDGLAVYILANNYQGVTFMPFQDGVNTGWSIE